MASPTVSHPAGRAREPRGARSRFWMAWALRACVLPLVFTVPAVHSASTSMPKIVLVTVDGLDAASLAAAGPLPALDRLAARGRLFHEGRSPAASVFPATVALLSGRGPASTGVSDEATRGLDARGRTLAEVLGARGFRGVALPADPLAHAESGLGRGFERFVASSPAIPESARVDSALAWLGHAGRRFAWLGLTLGAPAEPWRRPDGIGPAEIPALADRLREIEAAIVRLERGLERRNVAAVTIVAIAGTGGSAPARRAGGAVDATPCTVPFAIAGPGVVSRVAAPTAGAIPVSLLHVAPTLAALGGARADDFEEPPLLAAGDAPEWDPVSAECVRDTRALDPGDARADAACREAWSAAASARHGPADSVALESLRLAAERCTDGPRAAIEHASALSRAGREPDAARAFLDLTARYGERHPEAAIAYVDHLLRFRRFEMVAPALAGIGRDSPLAALAAWRGALARIGTLDLVTAREEIRRAAALAVPTPVGLEIPARVETLHAARLASDFEPRSLAARLAHARALGGLALYEEAYRELHVARGLDTTSAEPDFWMATLLMGQGRARHAVPTFERGLKRDPSHRASRLALADALLVLDRRADARRQLEAALALDPADARGQYNLACLLALDGEEHAALEALGRALDHGYADWERIGTDPDLETVRADPGFPALQARRPR